MDFQHWYGIMLPDHKWARHTVKRTALAYAKKHGGVVYRVGYGRNSAWDAPTTRASGDIIADYRKEGR